MQNWKSEALKRAELISDAWEVTKAYAGRIAEWVLFFCMIANIVEMLPGAHIAVALTNTVLGIQVVMLDIGGMSLGTMAAHIREQGNTEAAQKASLTSKFLIAMMIVTLLIVSIGVLFPPLKVYTDMAEKGLILVRVVMTVIYGHVIHSLRSSAHTQGVPHSTVPSDTELETIIRNIVVPVLEQYRTQLIAPGGQGITQVIDYQELAREVEKLLDNPKATFTMQEEHAQTLDDKPVLRQLPAPIKIDRYSRLESAYHELLSEGIKPTGQTLSARARCNRKAALEWLKENGNNASKKMVTA